MALIKPIHGEMSGKIGGNVYARNKGGTYVRAWADPVQPGTARQLQVRQKMANAVLAYSLIDAAKRAAWELYAANTPMVNRLGDTIYLTGQQHFCRSNVPVALAQELGSSASLVLDGPTTFGLPAQAAGLVATVGEAAGLSLAYDDSAGWANLTGSVAIIRIGRPRSPSRNFFKGPWRLTGFIDGDTAVPPVSPKVVAANALAYVVTQGQRVGIGVRVFHADGRLSTETVLDVLVGA
jgi:hypothetical protein